jgi:pantoate--beta-alanine ligase
MQIFKKAAELTQYSLQEKSSGKSIGFVPTMGALHDGHISLIRASKVECDRTIVSIFVNPTQFAPTEDLEKYPRPIEKDISLLEAENVEILFLPSNEEIYPAGASTFVTVGEITENFEGAIRPAHFRGVATVVASLFNIVQSDVAFFGQKDLQQAAVIKRMVYDLHFPITIKTEETIREHDGLALSSRNQFLSADEREEAPILSKTLAIVKDELLNGVSFILAKENGAKSFNSLNKTGRLEYLDIVDPETFHLANSFKQHEDVAIIIAAKIGSTRLIDNVLVKNNK